VLQPRMDSMGWPFAKVDAFPGAQDDPLYGSEHIKDLYLRAEPSFSGRFTVPVLWDSVHQTIVNNESSEIIRIFYHAFDSLNPVKRIDNELLPENLKGEIDEVNAWVYDLINSTTLSPTDDTRLIKI
jgi:putative glutathione S-transferase